MTLIPRTGLANIWTSENNSIWLRWSYGRLFFVIIRASYQILKIPSNSLLMTGTTSAGSIWNLDSWACIGRPLCISCIVLLVYVLWGHPGPLLLVANWIIIWLKVLVSLMGLSVASLLCSSIQVLFLWGHNVSFYEASILLTCRETRFQGSWLQIQAWEKTLTPWEVFPWRKRYQRSFISWWEAKFSR